MGVGSGHVIILVDRYVVAYAAELALEPDSVAIVALGLSQRRFFGVKNAAMWARIAVPVLEERQ